MEIFVSRIAAWITKRKAWLLRKFNMAASNLCAHSFGWNYVFSGIRNLRYFTLFYIYESKVIL